MYLRDQNGSNCQKKKQKKNLKNNNGQIIKQCIITVWQWTEWQNVARKLFPSDKMRPSWIKIDTGVA